jgi:hypothetical protein
LKLLVVEEHLAKSQQRLQKSDPSQMLLHDGVGNLKRETAAFGSGSGFSGTTNYLYDNKSQLLNESSTRNTGLNNVFGYDAMGNPTSWKGSTRTFNLNNQETTGGTSQFNYDGNGNPTTYKGSSFAFNENDKLTNVTTAGSVSLQAGYRSNGLRAWKNTANGTTYFLYDGHRLVCEFDGTGTLKNTNVWGANGLLARRDEVALSTRFYLWDDKCNIAQSLNADGSVAQQLQRLFLGRCDTRCRDKRCVFRVGWSVRQLSGCRNRLDLVRTAVLRCECRTLDQP